jgi:ferrous iron transport protein B
MTVQWIVVAVVVAFSAAYALWTLMPAALRRALAAALLRLPLPDAIAAPLRARADAASHGGCSGCSHNPLATKAAQPRRGAPVDGR